MQWGVGVAGGHRAKTATVGKSRRAKGRHRAKPEPRIAHGWLGAGAITLGVGAALATGSGVAHAEGTSSDGPSSSSSPSSGAGSEASRGPSASTGGTPSGPSNSTHDPGESPTAASPKSSETKPTTHGTSTTSHRTKPTGAPESGDTKPTTTADHDSTPDSTTPRPSDSSPDVIAPVTSVPSAGTASPDPAPTAGLTLASSTPPSSDSGLTHTVKLAKVAALAAVHPAAGPESPGPTARSFASAESAPAPTAAAASLVAPSPTPSVVAVLPAAATPVAPPLPGNVIVGVLSQVFGVVNTLIAPNPGVPPTDPLHMLAFELVRRIELTLGMPVIGTRTDFTNDPVIGTNPVSTSSGTPSAGDVVQTPYGDIGKWLLESNGQISDFGGAKLGGKTVLEPINVIIVDPTSSTAAEATAKFNAKMTQAGFPALPIHSTGFEGTIDGVTYGQQPAGPFDAYSNNFFLLPDDHARAFGPDPVQTASGFVWTVAISREQFGLSNGILPTHVYTSYNAARDELASRLIDSGATLVGIVPLSNSVDSATQTTGDHDGYAIVIQLND